MSYRPPEQVAGILDTIDSSVANGTLEGGDAGNSASIYLHHRRPVTSPFYRIAKLFLNDDVTAERRYTAIETFNYR